MSPIQQMLLGAGSAVATKTYVDNIFSTYLWKATNANRSINIGFDYTSNEGLVWIKNRGGSDDHVLFDTIRGANKRISSNSNAVENTSITNELKSFTSTGYNLGDAGTVNGNDTFASWNFKSAPGFLDIVEFSGNGNSSQVISHNLGSVPGMIILKAKNAADNWKVYHRGTNGGVTPEKWLIKLNDTQAASEYTEWWNDTAPTATNFTVGEWNNASGWDFIAYLFAGGESNASEARSVDFDGTDDRLTLAASNDFAFGTGDFTIECWVKPDSLGGGVFQISSSSGGLSSTLNCGVATASDNKWRQISSGGSQHACGRVEVGQWYHIASVRSSGVTKLYINGIEVDSRTDTANYGYDNLVVGGYYSTSYLFDGEISNFRVVKGTAVYTSSFRPPTEPLTNITNTKLLCCNNSSTTGKTTGGTITAGGNPTASTESPFDDPAGFVFGESGSESVIKCGSYKGNGSSTGPEIFLGDGWEPQFILMKNAEKSENWLMWDSMRGIVTGGNDARLFPNLSTTESSPGDFIDLTSTGFKIKDNGGDLNESGDTIIYLCIRRPDGYCGKLSELGTDVFAMDTGNSNADQAFTSGFPVDFAFNRQPATASQYQWEVGARLMQGKLLYTWKTDAEISYSDGKFDDNTGWLPNNGYTSNWQSWMWKRHAGFDVVAENNLPLGANIPHSLGKTPEMIIAKNRNNTFVWGVYHKGVNGGTNPEQYRLKLNTDDAQQQVTEAWNNTAPTATHFTVGANHTGNSGGADYRPIFFLFSSVAGISSVGSYTGNGDGSSGINVTTGFQPRFYMIKRSDAGSSPWYVVDSLRGMSNSGDEKGLQLENSQAQFDYNFGNTSSTGFTITATHASLNANGGKYIYYAHA